MVWVGFNVRRAMKWKRLAEGVIVMTRDPWVFLDSGRGKCEWLLISGLLR